MRQMQLHNMTDTSEASLAMLQGDTIQEIEAILAQVGSLFPVIQAVDPALSPIGAVLAPVEQLLLALDGVIRGTATAAGVTLATTAPTAVLSAPSVNPASATST